jgi:arylsulfatase A-like enzyme/Tfp pilus assembly protein PilF
VKTLGWIYRLLLPGWALILAFQPAWAQGPSIPQWNLLLISVDTLRADHLGAYGYRSVTPTLDRLAGEGVVFEQVYTPVPLTLPAHTSLLTGRYPPATGIHENGEILPSSVPTLAEQMQAQGFQTAGSVGAFILDRRFGLSRGFDEYWGEFPLHRYEGADPGTIQIRGDQVQAAAAQWISAHNSHRFFAFVHFYDLHGPYLMPAPWRARFPGRLYDGELAYVDDLIGKLWEDLVRLGISNRTLMVITADHGEGLGDHGEQTHGFLLYRSTTHVPLIVRFPDRQYAGKRVSTVARLIDIAPTVSALLGIPSSPSFQGRSLAPEISGQERPALPAYSETLYPYRHFHTAPLYALRDDRFAFVQAPRPEVYEFRQDPAELHDLIHTSQAVANNLRGELDNLLASMAHGPQASPASPEVLEELKSLGYVGPTSLSSGQPQYDPALPDPKDRIALYHQFQKVLELETHGDMRNAATGLERIASTDPALVMVQIEAGLARQQLHEDDSAVKHFSAALRADPQNSLAHFDLGVSLGNLRRYPEAVRELELATKLDPSNSRAFTVLGITRAQQGELVPAIAAFDRALAIDPSDFDALLNRGNVHLMLREWDKGRQDLLRAARVEPRDATIHQALGTMEFYQGDLDGALKEYREAVELSPRSSSVHSNLGLLYRKMGRDAEASAEFRRALARDPNNKEAAEGLQGIPAAQK